MIIDCNVDEIQGYCVSSAGCITILWRPAVADERKRYGSWNWKLYRHPVVDMKNLKYYVTNSFLYGLLTKGMILN